MERQKEIQFDFPKRQVKGFCIRVLPLKHNDKPDLTITLAIEWPIERDATIDTHDQFLGWSRHTQKMSG